MLILCKQQKCFSDCLGYVRKECGGVGKSDKETASFAHLSPFPCDEPWSQDGNSGPVLLNVIKGMFSSGGS